MAPQAPKPEYLILKEEWITMKEAAAVLHIGLSTMCKLIKATDPVTGKPYLVTFHPMPRNILISTASVQAHYNAVRNEPEFWERRRALQAAKGHKKRPGRYGGAS
jgi:hypothetical protein